MGKSFYSTVFLPRGPCRGGPTGGPQHQPNTVNSSPALLQPLCSPGPCSVSETQGAALGSSLLSLSKSVGAAGFQLSVLTYPCCYSLQCLDPTQPCTEEWIPPSSLEEIHPEITPSWRAVLQSSTLEILFSCLSQIWFMLQHSFSPFYSTSLSQRESCFAHMHESTAFSLLYIPSALCQRFTCPQSWLIQHCISGWLQQDSYFPCCFHHLLFAWPPGDPGLPFLFRKCLTEAQAYRKPC